MIINKGHPKYIKFIKKELKTLEFLCNNSFISNPFVELSRDAYNLVNNSPNKEKHLASLPFTFQSNFEIEIQGKVKKLIIGANVTPNFSIATYLLAICNLEDNDTRLIRKFHFDYAIQSNNDEEPKPIYHLQYGGKESPLLTSLNIKGDHLHPWLSLPRIIYSPINLALFLDMIFCEFRNDTTIKICRREEWREFIKENEDFILCPFYLQFAEFIKHKHSSEHLVRDYYYGNQSIQ